MLRFEVCAILWLMTSSISYAQSKCNCSDEFTFLESFIKDNYPGFTIKTPEYFGTNYDSLTYSYIAKSKEINKISYCLSLMKDWLGYFKDGHMQIYRDEDKDRDSTIIKARMLECEKIAINPLDIQAAKKSTSIEGVYYRHDSLFKVVVVKKPNSWRTYVAIVIESKQKNWLPGMVKFEMKEKNDSVKYNDDWILFYKCIYYGDDHEVYANKNMTFRGGFAMDGGIWKKEGLLESTKEQDERNKRKKEKKSTTDRSVRPSIDFKVINADCSYLRISDFDGSLALQIDSMLKVSDQKIRTHKYLILDLRDNGGGSDRSYESLLPYIYTNPIITTGVAIYATSENIKAWELRASVVSEEIKKLLDDCLVEMKKNSGKFTSVEIDTFYLPSVMPSPQKVAILINENCASTTEQFLLAAKQSKKVIMIGNKTSGILDYSNARSRSFPCVPFLLNYPTSRSGRLPQYPIDNVGISPNIFLNDSNDWIHETIEILRKTE